MKSSWAYNNGKRQLKEVASKDAPLTGWIKIGKVEAGDLFRYAERNKHDRSKLVVKTYANKTQALQKIKDLKDTGINCWMRLNYPFVIEAIDIKLNEVTND